MTPHHQHVKHLWQQSRHNPTNTTGEGNNLSDETRHQTLSILTILTNLNATNITVETREAFTIITHETSTALHQIFVSNIDGTIYPVQDTKPDPNTLIAILTNETNS